MITNNGLRLFTASLLGYYIPKSNVDSDINFISMKSPDNSTSSVIKDSATASSFPYTSTITINDDQSTTTVNNMRYIGHLLCGSGTTPPSREDIKLENCLTQMTRQSITENVDLGKLTITGVFTNTGEAVVVSEIGYYVPQGSSSGLSPARGMFLVMRKVLDTPIQVEAGETFSISYTFDFTTLTD